MSPLDPGVIIAMCVLILSLDSQRNIVAQRYDVTSRDWREGERGGMKKKYYYNYYLIMPFPPLV